MVIRRAVTVPAAGSHVELPVSGYAVLVESGAHTAPADVPTIHLDNVSNSPFPAYPAAKLEGPCSGFHRVYVVGTAASAGSTLYLLIQTAKRFEIVMPNTAVHA